MTSYKSKLFLAGVMAFAISASSCQMLSGLLGGGGGGGGGLDIASLLGGLGLADDPQLGSGLSLTGDTRSQIPYQVLPSNKHLTRDAAKLYGSY